MKKIMQFFIIFSLVFALSNQLFAKEVSGTLREGEGSSFVPFQGSSFSIISDVESGIYDGNFNISIRSGGEIIYQENDQIDDLYLVFNDPVDVRDEITLYVNSGIFIFKMSSLETLPDVIVDAIKEQKPAQYEQMKQLHHRPRKKVVEPVKPLPIVETKPIEPEPIVYPTVQPEPIIYPTKEPVVELPKYDSRVVKRAVEPYDYEKEQAENTTLYVPKPIEIKSELPKEFSKPIDIEVIEKPIIKRMGIDNLSKYVGNIDEKLDSRISSKKPIDNQIINSDIDKVAYHSKVISPKIASSGIKMFPAVKTFTHVLDKTSSPVGAVSKLPDTDTNEIESFSKTTSPMMQKSQIKHFKTEIATDDVTPPMFEKKYPQVVKSIKIEDKIVPPIMNNHQVKRVPVVKSIPQIEIKYKEPKVINPIVEPKIISPELIEKPIVRKAVEPKIISPELMEKPIVRKIVEPKIIKPDIIEKPIVRKMDKPKDRIVITKTISAKQKEESRVLKRHVKPQDYGRREEKIPEKMSNRVVRGTSYGVATAGKIRVKAYSNNRPISAWVEVFKDGTKQRIKTFYTGKGRALKNVKLPAGVYVIKATYRTAGSKRKKTVGRVTLDEGGSINKTITFDDGSLNVTVRKNGNPIYAKVEIFKAGKKRRIAYEFSSRDTGVASISLGSGKYDIVVRDHGDVRRFDSVSIQGSNSKSINADF